MTVRKNLGAIIAFGIVVALLGWVAFGNVYYIRDDSGGQLLWKADEAYLFVSVARRGYHLRVLDYPWLAFKEWLNAPTFPNDQRVLLTVIRVTPSGIERHVGKVAENTGEMPALFTPNGEAIFANCQGTPCKWVGDRFEKATQEEQQKLDGINHLTSDIDT